MTAQNFSSIADGNAFLRKSNLKFTIQLSFRISPPPEISGILIFITLQKNIKDAAISREMKTGITLECAHFQLRQLGI